MDLRLAMILLLSWAAALVGCTDDPAPEAAAPTGVEPSQVMATDAAPSEPDQPEEASSGAVHAPVKLTAPLPSGPIHPLSELDEPLFLLDRDPPEFPPELRSKPRSGHVILNVIVGRDGQVLACGVLEADHAEVGVWVRDHMLERRFSVPRVKGEPVVAEGRLPVPYRIGPGSLEHLFREDYKHTATPRR